MITELFQAWARQSAFRRCGAASSLAAVFLWVAGCERRQPPVEPVLRTVVAEVGSRAILADDLVAEASRRGHGRRPVPGREELLREITDREALLQRARAAGVEQNPAVRREIETLIISRFLSTELEARREALTVTPAEVQAEYEATRATRIRPAQVRLAMLFLATGSRMSEVRKSEVRARLQEARDRFLSVDAPKRAPEETGFGPLSLAYSDDQSTRYRGGDLGWLEKDRHPTRIPASVVAVGCALAVGKVSEVQETPEGYYLIQKTDARETTEPTFESIQASLEQTLLARKRQALEDQFRAETARSVPTLIHSQALAAVTLPVSPAGLAARNRELQPPGLPGTKESPHGN